MVRNGELVNKDQVTGWYMEEIVGHALEHLIKCPVHGVIAATGMYRGSDGKMLCLKCYPQVIHGHDGSVIRIHTIDSK